MIDASSSRHPGNLPRRTMPAGRRPHLRRRAGENLGQRPQCHASAERAVGWIGHRASAEHAAQVETLGSSGLADPPGVIRRVGRPGQQRPPGRDERGHERLQQPLEGDSAVGLHGHHRAVDGGVRTREMVGRNRSRHLWSRPVHDLFGYRGSAWCCSPARGRRGHPRPAARPVQPHLRGSGSWRQEANCAARTKPGTRWAKTSTRTRPQPEPVREPRPPRRPAPTPPAPAGGCEPAAGRGRTPWGGDRRVRDRARWNVAHLDVDPLIKANFGLFSARAHGVSSPTSAVARLLAQAEQTAPWEQEHPAA